MYRDPATTVFEWGLVRYYIFNIKALRIIIIELNKFYLSKIVTQVPGDSQRRISAARGSRPS